MDEECEHEWEQDTVSHMGSEYWYTAWFCVHCDEEKEQDCE